jgi:hypothetical protein
MPKTLFPPLRIVEEKMTNQEILETFNTAFGGNAVSKVTKSKNSRIIHIDQENEGPRSEWEIFYAYLDENGSIYIKAEYLGGQVYLQCGFAFSKNPRPGYWEVHYAKRKGVLPIGIVPLPEPKKVCTCGCTCGAGGRGSSF